MIEPRISVIVATYNWSNALLCTLQAIRQQSFECFEVLVIGDACTDDSEEIVRCFGDERFVFRNMNTNHRSQWAPNNLGLHLAKGIFVAYCGHDDIWHPDHLSSLLKTIDENEASAAVSGLLMYGPPGTDLVSQAGLYPLSTMGPSDFVPPSAFLHRRELVFDIGWWTNPDLIELPTDVEFQQRVMKHCPIYSTGTITVFKFNAAVRRDSYRTKNTDEQTRMLMAVSCESDCRLEEALKALKSFASGNLSAIKVPVVEGFGRGEVARRNRKFKGVDEPFPPSEMRRLDRPERFPIQGGTAGFEWHEIEESSRWGCFRWSGPLPTSIIDLPILVDRSAQIAIQIPAIAEDGLLSTMILRINGCINPHTIRNEDDGSMIAMTNTGALEGHLRITIELARTVRIGHDPRLLGLAVAWVDVVPSSNTTDL